MTETRDVYLSIEIKDMKQTLYDKLHDALLAAGFLSWFDEDVDGVSHRSDLPRGLFVIGTRELDDTRQKMLSVCKDLGIDGKLPFVLIEARRVCCYLDRGIRPAPIRRPGRTAPTGQAR